MLQALALTLALAMHPEEALIRCVAAGMGVDADYAVCIAWRESGMDPLATGELGEQGLFQIHPRTGCWVAEQLGWERYDGYDPLTNTVMGLWLLRQGYDDWFSTACDCRRAPAGGYRAN